MNEPEVNATPRSFPVIELSGRPREMGLAPGNPCQNAYLEATVP